MVLVQWIQSLGLGVLLGIGIGYLTWKLPQHLNQFAEWRWERAGRRAERKIQRKPRVRAQVERIEGMFNMDQAVPLTGPEMFPLERVLDFLERVAKALADAVVALGRELRAILDQWIQAAGDNWVKFLADTAPRDPVQMVRERG